MHTQNHGTMYTFQRKERLSAHTVRVEAEAALLLRLMLCYRQSHCSRLFEFRESRKRAIEDYHPEPIELALPLASKSGFRSLSLLPLPLLLSLMLLLLLLLSLLLSLLMPQL